MSDLGKTSRGERRPPDTLVLLLALAAVLATLTHVVSPGRFGSVEPGEGRQRTIAVDSYVAHPDGPQGVALFASGGQPGFLNAWFDGLVSGSRDGAAVGVVAFLLVLGGAFGIVLRTGVFDRSVLSLVRVTGAHPLALFPVLFVLFSLGGAVFGMGEETIPLVLLLAPILVRLGYDSISVVLVTFVATQIGFATSWMNPFSVVIAQGIAGLQPLSGAVARMLIWAVFTAAGAAFTVWWALRVRRRPEASPAYASDAWFRERAREIGGDEGRLARGDAAMILVFVAGMAWVVWGVTTQGYYLGELASQFLAMGLAIGAIAVAVGRLGVNDLADAFRDGAQVMLPVVLVIGLAKGLVVLLGGTDPMSDSVLNTWLYGGARGLDGLPAEAAAVAMLALQSAINFFAPSGSGQAALTMPILAPLGDLLGVTRQVSVLAFQLGDGLTNLIVPTSAMLMGVLGAARIPWLTWARFIAWPLAVLLAFGAIALLLAVATGWS
jgi:uncharacterized ion transporter superfamily protein YfcC